MRPDAARSQARCARRRSFCRGGIVIEGLNDSKKLSEKKREKLFDEITENALAWSVSLVDERVIDEINILQATFRAMQQAVDGLTTTGGFRLCGRQPLAGA